jgi:hypothetical protein
MKLGLKKHALKITQRRFYQLLKPYKNNVLVKFFYETFKITQKLTKKNYSPEILK